MKTLLTTCCLLLLGWFALADRGFASATAAIARFGFTSAVVDRVPADMIASLDVPPGQTIYFWAEYCIGPDGMALLHKNGSLPLRHVWRYGWAGIAVSDTIEVGITPDNWSANKAGYLAEFAKDGFFRFRTFSYKQNLTHSKYYIQCTDADNSEVGQFGSQGRRFRPSVSIQYK